MKSFIICMLIGLPFLSAQTFIENEIDFKPGTISQSEQLQLQHLDEILDAQKFYKIIEWIESEETSTEFKMALCELYLKPENSIYPEFMDGLKRNITFKGDLGVYTFDSFISKKQYPILNYLIGIQKEDIFNAKDLINSDLFKKCDLFSGWYEKMFLRFLFIEYFIISHGENTSELIDGVTDTCVIKNFKELSQFSCRN